MKNVVDFLLQLQQNNNKTWFDAHRSQYQEAQAEFHTFVEQLIEGIARFDPTVAGLTVKDCTYRIYRDTRFSPDKTPYKSHMGAYVCRGGKKSGYAGYYFHVEPSGRGMLGGNLLSAGLYCAEPKVVKSVREEIDDHGAELEAAICAATGFTLCRDNALKRVPAGFPADHPYAEYLKLKDVLLEKSFDNKQLLAGHLLERTLEDFHRTIPFINQLNRAVEYAFEEM